jgi:hypothetical protein
MQVTPKRAQKRAPQRSGPLFPGLSGDVRRLAASRWALSGRGRAQAQRRESNAATILYSYHSTCLVGCANIDLLTGGNLGGTIGLERRGPCSSRAASERPSNLFMAQVAAKHLVANLEHLGFPLKPAAQRCGLGETQTGTAAL